MKSFIKYILTVCLVVAVASSCLFYLINAGLRKQKTDYFGKLNELILGKENFDIIFLGSSRVNWTVNPQIIDSVTSFNTFNFGLDGAYIVEDGINLRAYLKSHPKPKLVVINIDPRIFYVTDEIKTPSRYLPYVNHPEIYDTLKYYSNWPVIAKYMPFVATTFYPDGIVNQAFQAFAQPKRKMENYYKGFSPLKKVWDKEADVSLEGLLTVTYTTKGFSLFRNFLSEIKKRDIPLQLIYSPQYDEPAFRKTHEEFMTKLNTITREFSYNIKDYTTLDICKEKKYFFDATHLNITGANLFSKQLGGDLDLLIHAEKNKN